MKKLNLAIFGFILAGLTACGGGGNNTTSQDGLSGLSECIAPNTDQAVVCGSVLANDGVTPLVNAEITLLEGGAKLAARGVANDDICLTDSAGDFVCLLPTGISGTVILNVSLNGFDDQILTANVSQGQTIETGSQILSGNVSNRWVVIPGAYDGVQVLLAQLKGCTLTGIGGGIYNPASDPASARGSLDCESKGLIVLDTENQETTEDLLSSSELLNNDSLFVNCDANFSTPTINGLVQDFVANGGHATSQTYLTHG